MGQPDYTDLFIPIENNDITKKTSLEKREEKLTKWILSRVYLFDNMTDEELDKVLKAIDTLLTR